MSIKGLPARAWYGWYEAGDTFVKVAVDVDGKIQITSTNLTSILAAVQHETYGLEALKDMLVHETYGLSAVKTLIDDIKVQTDRLAIPEGQTAWGALVQLDDRLYDVRSMLAYDEGHPASILGDETGALCPSGKSIWDALGDGVVNLNNIEDKIDDIEAKLDSPDDFKADVSALAVATTVAADFDRHLTKLDCWGDLSAIVTITDSPSDVNLPDVIVPALPTGATIWKVVLIGVISAIRDTSGSDNAVNGAAAIKIKKSTGAWGTDDIVALDIADNAFAVDVTNVGRDRGGAPLMGNINNDDLSGEVDAAATYNLRFEDIAADGNNLTLLDVTVGLRIYFY